MLGKAPPERQKVKKGLLEALFLLVSRLDVKKFANLINLVDIIWPFN